MVCVGGFALSLSLFCNGGQGKSSSRSRSSQVKVKGSWKLGPSPSHGLKGQTKMRVSAQRELQVMALSRSRCM